MAESLNPTCVKDGIYLCTRGPPRLKSKEEAYGKWLVFRPYDQLDETWHMIRRAVKSGELRSLGAQCSTGMYNPSEAGPGPETSGVICVYSTREEMDDVGLRLIQLVKHDIRYKTDEASRGGVYIKRGAKRATIKTIYWNNGEPSFEFKGISNPGPRHGEPWLLNHARAPEPLASEEEYGRWVIQVEHDDLTELWHEIKEEVESGQLGAKEMICPAKRHIHDSDEMPTFHVYTSRRKKDEVGFKLIHMIEDDIVYEPRRETRDPWMNWRDPRGGSRNHRRVRNTTLYWNDGEPAYEVVRRAGITRNWRTGEKM